MRAGGRRALWLEEALAAEAAAPASPPLRGAREVDVAIAGGGYVGLWTAIWCKRLEPGCRVAVVERDTCGSGASGRNGGLAQTWWPKAPSFVAALGPAAAAELLGAAERNVGELLDEVAEQGIDCDARRAGSIWAATTPAQVGSWTRATDAAARLGATPFRSLGGDELRERFPGARLFGAVEEAHAATVQPAKLARGLRRWALRLGVELYEHTAMEGIEHGPRPLVRCAQGRLRAGAVVLATNAWAAAYRPLRPRLFVVGSTIVATPRAPDALARAAWTTGEGFADARLQVRYFRTTPDGRMAFGVAGGRVAFAGRVGERFDHDARAVRRAVEHLREVVPAVAALGVEAAWSGPVDRTASGLPLIGPLGAENVFAGVGWSGSGVAQSRLGGRALASLALARDDDWARSPLVGLPSGRLAPEPARWLGAQVVQGAVRRVEDAQTTGRRPRRLDTALTRLVPGVSSPRAR